MSWMMQKLKARLGKGVTTSAADPDVPTEHHDVIVVGGGTAGLYTAYKLVNSGITSITVLESRPFVGGRVTTTHDEDGSPLFNNFAWRVSEINTQMIDLAKELGLKLIPQVTPPEDKEKEHHKCKHGVGGNVCGISKPYEIPPNRAPLSDFATACLTNAADADLQDRESGYAGRTSQISWPNETHGTNTFVVEGGMDLYPKTLASKLPEGCLRVNHRVADVERTEDGTYAVCVMKRAGNDYAPVLMTAKTIVLAATPYAIRRFTVASDLMPALSAVHERRLGHVIAKCGKRVHPDVPDRSDVPDRIYRKISDSVLQQVISGDYGRGIFQAAYACDRFERVWREMQYHGPQIVMEQVKSSLKKLDDMKVPPDGWDDTIEEVYVRIGFVHRWHIEAHVNGKNKEELSLQALTPNVARLPNLYLAGEAFSPHQGWTEGALWTAGKVADMIVKAYGDKNDATPLSGNSKLMTLTPSKANPVKYDGVEENFIVYRGIVVDTSDWHHRHPGGVGMITGHAKEDLSELFDNFHGAWPAPLATLFGMQIGCTTDV